MKSLTFSISFFVCECSECVGGWAPWALWKHMDSYYLFGNPYVFGCIFRFSFPSIYIFIYCIYRTYIFMSFVRLLFLCIFALICFCWTNRYLFVSHTIRIQKNSWRQAPFIFRRTKAFVWARYVFRTWFCLPRHQHQRRKNEKICIRMNTI